MLTSALAFRSLPGFGATHRTAKLVHLALNSAGVVAALVGGALVLVYKLRNAYLHLATPHAVLGLLCLILLAVQFILGLAVFLCPVRIKATGFWLHRSLGTATVIFLTAALTTGATKLSPDTFRQPVSYSQGMTAVAVLATVLGCIVLLVLSQPKAVQNRTPSVEKTKSEELDTPLL